MSLVDKICLFLKGVVIGITDLIPGVSGGTVALILRIYERMMRSLKHFSSLSQYFFYFKYLFNGNSEKRKEYGKKFDIEFMSVVVFGLLSASILGSKILTHILEEYKVYAFSFFIGLILASSRSILLRIRKYTATSFLLSILGIIAGVSFLLFIPHNVTQPEAWYLVFGGFISIFAMFLPGISGSFLLLVTGLYEYVVGLIATLPKSLPDLLPYIGGAILGLICVSHLVSFLFKKNKDLTLAFLLGLVLGSLCIPMRELIKESYYSVDPLSPYISVGFFLFGVIAVVALEFKKKKDDEVKSVEND